VPCVAGTVKDRSIRHDSAYFRGCAQHCRELAKAARDQSTINYLTQMAEDFEEEAGLIEEAENKRP